MKNCNDIGIYQDGDGQVYRFLWDAFNESFGRAAVEKGKEWMRDSLANEVHISEHAVTNHLRNRGTKGANFPNDIAIVREYGRVLEGDENAFLEPITPRTATRVNKRLDTPESMLEEVLKDWDASDAAVAKELFRRLWDLLGLYASTDCFNHRPDTKEDDGAEKFFSAEIDTAIRLTRAVKDIQNRINLQEIVRETGDFLRRYERPGVSDRWLSLNQRLRWFDPVYDLADVLPAEEMTRLAAAGFFRVPIPTPWERELRKSYFSTIGGSEDEIFTCELQETLVCVFRQACQASGKELSQVALV